MRMQPAAANPDAYVAGLSGWRRDVVEQLRTAVLAAGPSDEQIKWGHLVYLSCGPACLIRAEDERVLFGLWRGQRLREIEPRLKPGGKYEMATLVLHAGDAIDPQIILRLAAQAMELSATLGDPTKV